MQTASNTSVDLKSPGDSAPRAWNTWALPALHLLTLFGFTLAQPLFGLLSKNPTFLLYHSLGRNDLLVLALGLGIAGPLLVALLVSGITAIHEKSGRLVLAGLVTLLVSAFVLMASNRLSPAPPLAATFAALLGILAGVCYHRNRSVRLYLTILSPSALLFVLLFLAHASVRNIATAGTETPSALELIGSRTGHDTPVVFVLFDGVPLVSLLDQDLTIDSHLFPHFAALAERSTWYRNATTVHWDTHLSIPAILSGQRPKEDQPPTLQSYPQNLFTVLAPTHEVNAWEGFTSLAPEKKAETRPRRWSAVLTDLAVIYLHLLLPRPWTQDLPALEGAWGDFRRHDTAGPLNRTTGRQVALLDRRLRDFRAFLRSLEDVPRATVSFFYSGLPHIPWRYLPSGRLYGGLPRNLVEGGNPWETVPWYPILGYQRHMLQMQLVDRLVGELVDRLESLEIFDDSLVVVTSDHGASHWPASSRRRPLEATHPDDIVRIPLFFKLPGQEQGRIHDGPVETVDILPTLSEALDAPLPLEVQGRSQLDPAPSSGRSRRIGIPGKEMELPTLFAPDRASLERKHELFPRHRGDWRIYGAGRYGDLLGMALDEIEHGPKGEVEAALFPSSQIVELDPNEPYVNNLLTGHIAASPGRDKIHIVIGIGGRVAGVATSAMSPEGASFAVLVPEELLVDGPNPAELFLVEGDPESPLLRPPAALTLQGMGP